MEMNALAILLTTLTSLFSLVGLAPEELLEQEIRQQLEDVETLAIRVDATPNHKLLQGKLDRFRLAGRGLYPLPAVRIDTLDIETDPVDLDMTALRQGRIAFDHPFQAAFNLMLTQADIDRALRSPLILDQLETISISLLGNTVGQMGEASLIDPKIRLLEGDRLQFAAVLRNDNTQEQLTIKLTTGLTVVQGTQLQLIEPCLTANGVEFPFALIESTLTGLSQQYSLTTLEPQGITARILRLQITDERSEERRGGKKG
ncbi:MAG: DUF2993 domain-containing protein, partial [Cyanothece sp. SIO2G6]|nr:DUF2993 domain-containing protein [Cyanothece sp. SIO2G6]